MFTKLKSHRQFLRRLANLTKAKRREAITQATPRQVRCICECSANLLAGNIRIGPSQKRTLSKHKHLLRKLADKRRKFKSKKKLLIQSGGSFLFALLPAAISAIASLVR